METSTTRTVKSFKNLSSKKSILSALESYSVLKSSDKLEDKRLINMLDPLICAQFDEYLGGIFTPR